MLGEDDALWAEFAAESEEHLDAIEALLGGNRAPDAAGVNTLFRAFHSLKGMSDALGAPGMKNVAHVAEDLLGQARSGRLVVQAAVAEGLLAAVDALRRQRQQVLATRRDQPADPALIAQLSRLANGSPAPPPPAAAPRPPAPAGDGDPLLGSLASRAALAAPLLARLGGETDAARDPAALQEAAELAGAAAMLGLMRLAAGFEELARAAGGAEALPALGLLRRQLEGLAARAGESAGAEAIPGAVRGSLAPRLAALAVQVEALAEGGAEAAQVAAAARAAAAAACAMGFPALETLLLRLEDLADRATDPDAATLLAMQAPALAERLRAAAEGGAEAMRTPLPPQAGAEPADPRIPAPFAAGMGEEARRRTLAALAAGQRLLRVRMALGRGDAGAAALENSIGLWLRQQAEVLASRSLVEEDPPGIDLLVASGASAEALAEAAAVLDPARAVLRAIAEAGPEPAAEAPGGAGTPVTMRVRQETIDGIITLESEVRAASLALSEALQEGGARDAIARLSGLEQRLPRGAAREMAVALDRLRRFQDRLEEAESRLTLSLRRLDDAVMELRVVPIGTLFARLPRVVRAVARASGKEVELTLSGQEVAIDRSLVELLADPLLHLVRNAVDHGLESHAVRAAAGKPPRGSLRISARRRTGQIHVSVAEDGAGIDRARVLARAVQRGLVSPEAAPRLETEAVHALLFRPGFSTAEAVTETSGRGVGLDVVQDAVRRAGGTLEVASQPGQGTRFTLRLPLTAAIQNVLLVTVAGHPYALPSARVEAVMDRATVPEGTELVVLATLLALEADRPRVPVRAEAGLPWPGGAEPAAEAIVLVRSAGRAIGLVVDRVQRRTDLLLRPLHPALAALPAIGGVGVLGNGDPVVVLEPDGLPIPPPGARG
jgi:two-component system chemotaxis sensor kinase CheA